MSKTYLTIEQYRELGKQRCETKGPLHYAANNIEPIEFMISNNLIEDFAIANIIKYSTRFKHTRNLNDLMKVADYAQILTGVEVQRQKELEAQMLQNEKEAEELRQKLKKEREVNNNEKEVCGTCDMPNTRKASSNNQ